MENDLNTTQKNLLYSALVLVVSGSASPVAPFSVLLWLAHPIVTATMFAKNKKRSGKIGHSLAGFSMSFIAIMLGVGFGSMINPEAYESSTSTITQMPEPTPEPTPEPEPTLEPTPEPTPTQPVPSIRETCDIADYRNQCAHSQAADYARTVEESIRFIAEGTSPGAPMCSGPYYMYYKQTCKKAGLRP